MTDATSEAETRIRHAIQRALRLPEGDGGHLELGATPGWDSTGHMAIVLEVEMEFGVQFPAFRLPELVDVPAIARAIEEERAGGSPP
ncbi:MAG TPA: acyl carrier protein [Vicinamibacterales bacterium]|nr:acyl carrier protein [Vicinamibacterales bacterium]